LADAIWRSVSISGVIVVIPVIPSSWELLTESNLSIAQVLLGSDDILFEGWVEVVQGVLGWVSETFSIMEAEFPVVVSDLLGSS